MRRAFIALLLALAAAGCDPQAIPEDVLASNLQEVLTQERARFDALRQELDSFQNLFRLQTAALCLIGCGLGVALFRIYRGKGGAR